MVLLFLFLLGFGLAVSGGVTLIAYLNFLPAGLNWNDYFMFISGQMECYFLPTGIMLMAFVIMRLPKNL